MIFLFDLPEIESGRTRVYVVVGKLSKQAHFARNKSSHINAKDAAEHVYKEIYEYHALPREIISD